MMAQPLPAEEADYNDMFDFMVNYGLACPICDSGPTEVVGVEVGHAMATCKSEHLYAIGGSNDGEILRGF